MTYHKILVAIDNSAESEIVFQQAIDLAQKEKAQLMVFHAIQVEAIAEMAPMIGTGMGLVPSTTRPIPELQNQQVQAQIDRAKEFVRTYGDRAESLGVPTEFHHQIGDPGDLVCQLAKSWGANLIVVGRRGRRGMAEIFLGSVSNHVTHHAPCSVLVVQGAIPTE